MTIKTTYICDRCGVSHEKADSQGHLWTVTLTAVPFPTDGYYYVGDYEERAYPKMYAQWCRPCVELLGIKTEKVKETYPKMELTKEQLDLAVREVLHGVLRRGLSLPDAAEDSSKEK